MQNYPPAQRMTSTDALRCMPVDMDIGLVRRMRRVVYSAVEQVVARHTFKSFKVFSNDQILIYGIH